MNYDELARTVPEDAARLATAREEAETLRTQVAWYEAHDPEALGQATVEAERVSAELAEVGGSLRNAKAELLMRRAFAAVAIYVPAVLPAALADDWPGKHKKAKTQVVELGARHAELSAQHGPAQDARRDRRADAKRHAAFDRAVSGQRLAELDDTIAVFAPLHEERSARLTAINEELKPLLADLAKTQLELRQVISPSSQESRLRGIERRLEKRISQVKRKGTMVVRSIIIDGSNFRFDSTNNEIGLDALRPLCAELVKTKKVLVVFDANIMRKLNFPDAGALAAALPGVDVHPTSSRNDADELILDLAKDDTTYVLSNDTYPEYMSTAAMKDDRVLGVEIIDALRVVKVPMLDLEVPYTRTR